MSTLPGLPSSHPANGWATFAEPLPGPSPVKPITVFGEGTPAAALGTIRPQGFVKGGNYAGMEIAEADALATGGGGRAVVPAVVGAAGRSASGMIGRCVGRSSA